MFDPVQSMTTGDLASVVDALSRVEIGVDDAERIDHIRLLERLKSAAAAAQARVATAFAASQKAAQVGAGTPAKDIGKGVAAQVGLAKRESPARASRYVGWATILTTELPHTFAALQAGSITEWRAPPLAPGAAPPSLPGPGPPDGEARPPPGALGGPARGGAAQKAAHPPPPPP